MAAASLVCAWRNSLRVPALSALTCITSNGPAPLPDNGVR